MPGLTTRCLLIVKLISVPRENVLLVQYEVLWNLSSNQSNVLHAVDMLRPQVDVSLPLDDRYQSGSENKCKTISKICDKYQDKTESIQSLNEQWQLFLNVQL